MSYYYCKGCGSVIKERDVWVFCLLQQVLDRLHRTFRFTVPLGEEGAAGEVSEAKRLSEFDKLPRAKLRTVVRDNDLRDALSGE